MKNIINIVLFGVFCMSCQPKVETLSIGHRGAKGHVAENTSASVEKALALGADGVEIDVFRCKSGEIVVFHDKTLERTTNREGYIEDFTYFQLRGILVEENYHIPLLQDILKIIDKKALLNVELKGSGTATTVSQILNYYIANKGWKPEQFIVSSFNWDELKAFKKVNTQIPLGILTDKDPLEAISIAKELEAKAICSYYKNLTQENIKKIQGEGFKVNAWTVNNPRDIKQLKQWQVNAIISDYPERVK